MPAAARWSGRASWGACVLVAALSTLTCGPGGAEKFDKVILISIDTLRADYVGAFGGPAGITPELDGFSATATVFEDAITQATSTLPAHSSILYSLQTFVHRAYIGNAPDPQMTTPVEALRDAGYRTAAFVGGGQLRPQLGLSRGFDTYEVVNTREINEQNRGRDRLDDLFAHASLFLRRHGSEPFFLFLHTYEPHYPYDPPDRFRKQVAAVGTQATIGVELDAPLVAFESDRGVPRQAWVAGDRRSLYAAAVRYVDDFFGRLMRHLQELKLADDVVIVFLSDHGESLGERGLLGHNLLTTEQLRVPLIVRVPGLEPSRLTAPVQLIDVMPTLFSLMGERPPYPFMGHDLRQLLEGARVIEVDRVRVSENKGSAAVLRGPWKVVFELDDRLDFELFHLLEDPGELNDRGSEQPARALDLIAEYERMFGRHSKLRSLFPRGDDVGVDGLDPELVRELRALGYIQ